MTSTDPISDMLTRIRNAIAVNKTTVSLPYSNVKLAVAQVLVKNKFIEDVKVAGEGKDKIINIRINDDNANAAITEINRISRPGRRVYARANDIPAVKSGRGIIIVSTSKGLMSGAAAKKAQIGGELICKVY